MPDPGRRSVWKKAAMGLGALWLLGALGAWIYARMKGIPLRVALPVGAAFLIEIPFYLAPGIGSVREWLGEQGKARAAALMVASAMLPWLIYGLATEEVHAGTALLLLGAAGVVAFWYFAFPASPVSDGLFLTVVSAIYLSKIFDRIYLSPIPKLSLSVLGHLMLIHTAALGILVLRGGVTAEYRFLPKRAEWVAGLRYFGMMLPVVGGAYWALGLVKFRPHPYGAGLTLLQGIGTFFGILWVVALSEEFFFRGLLQQWVEDWSGRRLAGLAVASAVFGCAHLGFHRVFPNWQWAIVAGILGVFCGLAWRSSRSVQSAMVAHALAVTVWQVFLI